MNEKRSLKECIEKVHVAYIDYRLKRKFYKRREIGKDFTWKTPSKIASEIK